jgi:fructokinase
MSQKAKDLTLKLFELFPKARRFYDINLRKDNYTTELINELLPLANVVKVNDKEADAIQTQLGWSCESLEDFCKRTADQFRCDAVCVTRGEAGCMLLVNGQYVEARGYKVKVVDTVGAGDAAAAAIIHGLVHKWPASEIADFANRAGAVVSSCSGGAPAWTIQQAEALIQT